MTRSNSKSCGAYSEKRLHVTAGEVESLNSFVLVPGPTRKLSVGEEGVRILRCVVFPKNIFQDILVSRGDFGLALTPFGEPLPGILVDISSSIMEYQGTNDIVLIILIMYALGVLGHLFSETALLV